MTREEAIKHIITYAYYEDDIPLQVATALDMAITALRAQQEQESKPLNGWISVKDRLPEMGEHYQSEDVLVCINYRPDDPDTTEDTYVSIDHVDFNCFGQGEFSCERDDPRGGEPSPYFVTHWMPTPEPPEMGKAEE